MSLTQSQAWQALLENRRKMEAVHMRRLSRQTPSASSVTRSRSATCSGTSPRKLGKQLATNILPELAADEPAFSHDGSTNGLINHVKRRRTALRAATVTT
jgi:hypothetical protein